MKDILAMYLLNSVFQNAVKVWQDSIDVNWVGLVDGVGGEKFVNVDIGATPKSKPAMTTVTMVRMISAVPVATRYRIGTRCPTCSS